MLEAEADPNACTLASGTKSPLEGAPLHNICSCICSAYASLPSTAAIAAPFVTDIVRDLLAHGATICSETMLLLPNAAHRGRLSVVQFLIEVVGVDPNFRGRQGMTSLHFAARTGKIDVVNWLLDSVGDSIDINIVDDAGKRAVDYAAANGKQDIVDILLKRS